MPLIEAHKQVIITCDTYPKEISGMEDRLISRFGWGLTVAIEPPELEMRVAILIKKAEADASDSSEDVAFFIAKHIQSNVRELEGGLKRVIAYSKFRGAAYLGRACAGGTKGPAGRIQYRQIFHRQYPAHSGRLLQVKVSEMYSKKRSRNVARPRQWRWPWLRN